MSCLCVNLIFMFSIHICFRDLQSKNDFKNLVSGDWSMPDKVYARLGTSPLKLVKENNNLKHAKLFLCKETMSIHV